MITEISSFPQKLESSPMRNMKPELKGSSHGLEENVDLFGVN